MEGEFPEEMKCPICFEIPEKEIFLCRNGHTICDVCSESLSLCPQCRVDFGTTNKIRNRALEQLLDMIKFHCFYRAQVCQEKVIRKEITKHNNICKFGGTFVPFCKFFGYKCGFQMNTRNRRKSWSHILITHHIIPKAANFLEARFSKFPNLGSTLNIMWKPIPLEVYNECLIVTVSYKINSFAVTCFSMNDLSSNFLIEFRIETKTREVPDIRWITLPICFTQAENIIQYPPLMTSANLLSESYLDNGNLVLHLFVHGDRFPLKDFHEMGIIDMIPLTSYDIDPPFHMFMRYVSDTLNQELS